VEIVLDRQRSGQALAFGDEADALELRRTEGAGVGAEHGRDAAVGPQHVHQHAQCRGLAGSVRPEQREHRPFRHSKIQFPQRFEATEALLQLLRLNDHSTRP
jgi:hypothetical protein